MLKKTINDIKSYFISNDVKNIILSISGGVDSIFLLYLLLDLQKRTPFQIILYHTNYNMNSNSIEALNFVKKLSDKYDLKFFYDNIKIDNKNFESNARKYRYEKLNELLIKQNSDLILTAHHYDDQLETLIMKEEEGSDWISMLGIRYRYKNIYRPLLTIPKNIIIQNALNNNYSWIEDTSNSCLNFKRNKIRKQLNEGVYLDTYISKLSKMHRKSKKMMISFQNKYSKNFLKYICNTSFNSISIDLTILQTISDIEEFKLFIIKTLDDYLNISNITCTRSHWKNIFINLKNSKQGSISKISNNINILKDRKVFVIYINTIIDPNYKVRFDSKSVNWYESFFILSDSLTHKNVSSYLEIPNKYIDKGLYITHWKDGDKIKLNDHYKKISDLFINNKISILDKKYYPIVRDNNNNILWVPNIAKINYTGCSDSVYITWRS